MSSLIKIEKENTKIEIVFEKGFFKALIDNQIVFEDSDYETVRYVALGY